MKKFTFTLGVICLMSFSAFTQTTYYVKPSTDGGDDTAVGTSWGTAFATLGKALTSIAANDVILVSQGTFKEPRLSVNSHVTLKGGYNPATGVQDYANKTILDGGEANNIMNTASNKTIIVDGFVFQNGKSNQSNGAGAFFNYRSTATLSNCLFKNNLVNSVAGSMGGAVVNNGRMTIINCGFINNNARGQGGGVYSATSGTAMTAELNIINCTFEGNYSGVETVGETTYRKGGAICVVSGSATINNSIIWNNNSGSTAVGSQIENATALTLDHNILQGSVDMIYNKTTGTVTLVNNVSVDATDVDPLLEEETMFLKKGSAAINKGNNSLLPSGYNYDLLGFQRIEQTTVDLGCYESSFTTSTKSKEINQIRIFPNPTEDFLIIERNNNESFNVKIIDIAGKALFNQHNIRTGESIFVGNYPKGLYVIQVNGNTQKFLKK